MRLDAREAWKYLTVEFQKQRVVTTILSFRTQTFTKSCPDSYCLLLLTSTRSLSHSQAQCHWSRLGNRCNYLFQPCGIFFTSLPTARPIKTFVHWFLQRCSIRRLGTVLKTLHLFDSSCSGQVWIIPFGILPHSNWISLVHLLGHGLYCSLVCGKNESRTAAIIHLVLLIHIAHCTKFVGDFSGNVEGKSVCMGRYDDVL